MPLAAHAPTHIFFIISFFAFMKSIFYVGESLDEKENGGKLSWKFPLFKITFVSDYAEGFNFKVVILFFFFFSLPLLIYFIYFQSVKSFSDEVAGVEILDSLCCPFGFP